LYFHQEMLRAKLPEASILCEINMHVVGVHDTINDIDYAGMDIPSIEHCNADIKDEPLSPEVPWLQLVFNHAPNKAGVRNHMVWNPSLYFENFEAYIRGQNDA
jgi:hypothetical protein